MVFGVTSPRVNKINFNYGAMPHSMNVPKAWRSTTGGMALVGGSHRDPEVRALRCVDIV